VRRHRPTVLLIVLVLLAAACGPASSGNSDLADRSEGEIEREVFGPTSVVSEPDPDLYDPVAAGEPLPENYQPLAPRDAIFPVYEPSFVAAESSPWADDILVVGVDLEGEARAYPIGFLNAREIVVDLHRGIPTLVTW